MKSYNEQLIQKLTANHSKECYTAILKKWSEDGEMYDKSYSKNKIKEVMIEQAGEVDAYFSLNTFIFRYTELKFAKESMKENQVWIPVQVRQTRNVRHLNAVVIDYDYYKIKELEYLTPVEFWESHVEPNLPYGLTPTAVVDSGRGLYLIYAFKDCSKKWNKAYSIVAEKLINEHKHLGADPRCKDITRVIRIPGSINSRNNKEVECIVFNDTNYDLIKDFSFLWKASSSTEKTKNKNNQKSKLKSSSSNNKGLKKTTFGRMYDDFKKLITMRNETFNWEGYRETMLYITSFEAQRVGYSLSEADDFTERLAHRMKKKKDVDSLLTASRVTRKYSNGHSIAKIIEKLEITEEEFEQLDYLVPEDIKKFRNNLKRKAARQSYGYTKKELEVINRQHKVNALKLIGVPNAEIARILHVERQTVANDMKAIKSLPHRFALTFERIKAFNAFEQITDLKELRQKLIEFKNYVLAQMGIKRIQIEEDDYLGSLLEELQTSLEMAKNRPIHLIDTG